MTYWSFSTALKMIGKKSAFPPLGLATIAAMLPDSCECRLLDLNVEPLTDRDLDWADVVFLSAMIVQRESFDEVRKRANQQGVPVVAGGPYPSSDYPALEGIDHFVIGEAEEILPRFWSDFVQGKAKRAYARPVSQREVDAILAHFGNDTDVELCEDRPDINRTPIPRFDLLRMKAYRSMAVQASRGCPIGCEFCDIWRRFGRKPRFKSPEKFLEELESLYRLNWRGVVFVVDDNFIGNRNRAKELLWAMRDWQISHGYPFLFFTEGTLTIADDDELLQGFRDAGFDMVFVGIETPSEESLRETRKHINNLGSMADKVEKMQRTGLMVTSGFILGFDNDPDNIADLMIEFIQNLGIPVAMVGLMQALPETDLHDRLESEGRLLSKASGNNTHCFQTNFQTRRPMEQVSADYQRILQAIYPSDLKAYFQRCAVLRDRWRLPKKAFRIAWSESRAFLYYMATLLFRPYRRSAIKFLLETLWRKPSFLVDAISLGVQGHHFRQITYSAFEADRLQQYFLEKRVAFSRVLRQYMDGTAQSKEAILAEFRRFRDETLQEARRKVEKLHKDAQATIGSEYERFAMEINDMYQQAVQHLLLGVSAMPQQDEIHA
ncbi:MAG TPA: radical SAM protein [bacterium]|nr:radical SAM protein [bacterium]